MNNSAKKERQSAECAADIGARIVRTLFVWGLAAVLAFSAYTGLVRGVGGRGAAGLQGAAEVNAEIARGAAEANARTAQESVEANARTAQGAAEVNAEIARGAVEANARTAQGAAEANARTTQEVVEANAGTAQESVEANARGKAAGKMSGGEEKEGQSTQTAQVALTFDDGPHPHYTEELLDGLKERGVRATFFLIGKNIPGNEDVVRRMAREGHLIGNHTYDHVKICDMSGEDACEQLEKTNALIREITGEDTEFVRPPFGAWNAKMECEFEMIPVLWTVDPKDWTTKNVSDIVRRVLEDTEDGDTILLHDYYKSSVEAALKIVDELQKRGFEFVTVQELILE